MIGRADLGVRISGSGDRGVRPEGHLRKRLPIPSVKRDSNSFADPYPKGWCKLAGQLQAEAELETNGRCVARGQPYGGEQ